jgi:putative transposase
LVANDETPCDKASRRKEIEGVARQVHAKARGCYGAVRLQAALARRGHALSLSSTKRLARQLGLVQRPKRRRISTTDSKHDSPIAPNVLEQRFDAIHTPNRV